MVTFYKLISVKYSTLLILLLGYKQGNSFFSPRLVLCCVLFPSIVCPLYDLWCIVYVVVTVVPGLRYHCASTASVRQQPVVHLHWWINTSVTVLMYRCLNTSPYWCITTSPCRCNKTSPFWGITTSPHWCITTSPYWCTDVLILHRTDVLMHWCINTSPYWCTDA